MKILKLLVGLGNPGNEYAATKHNVGFMLIDEIAKSFNATGWKSQESALVASAYIGTEKVILVKPQTFMNESGRAVGPLLSWYKLDVGDLIVAHDDMDIPAGTIRIRKKGSAGGHNGMKSILSHVKDENFPRVRIGIGRPAEHSTVIHHVLSPFNSEDASKIKEALDYLVPAVDCLIKDGVDLAMNRFNPHKVKKSTGE